jgi:hypothetical protein
MADLVLTKVKCPLRECLFFHAAAEQAGEIYCKHPNKPMHMYAQPCPLYKLDVIRQAQANPELLSKMNRGRRR